MFVIIIVFSNGYVDIMMELNNVINKFGIIKELFFLEEMEENSNIWSFFVVKVIRLL